MVPRPSALKFDTALSLYDHMNMACIREFMRLRMMCYPIENMLRIKKYVVKKNPLAKR